jgi:hypothetical protein
LFVFSFLELLDQLGQWSKFARVDELELVNEVDEVLEARIQVRLCAEQHDVLEVGVVDVRVHSEQPFENHLYYVHEVLWKWNSQSAWEDLLVVKLVLHPGHQEVYVLARTYFQRSLYVVAVCPQVLVLWASAHCRTTFASAKLHQDAVQHIYFVVELDCVHSQPFV